MAKIVYLAMIGCVLTLSASEDGDAEFKIVRKSDGVVKTKWQAAQVGASQAVGCAKTKEQGEAIRPPSIKAQHAAALAAARRIYDLERRLIDASITDAARKPLTLKDRLLAMQKKDTQSAAPVTMVPRKNIEMD